MIRRGVVLLIALAGCTDIPVSPQLLATQCAEQARAALGPTGSVTLGANSNSGPFSRAEIGISSDFIRGLAPETVYDRCWFNRTGELPTIPLVLPRP
ncbi:hypothetical protein [Yoonia sp. 208BN28-4]|uniref:hypothetical protein n=1 Tax=Yoonia sp. 208BN28-4 TaxID=3126505 RepID=UPI0030B1AEA1